MKKILQNRRGETIVEVVVSFMLLLMFTAMFVVSLRYARAMSRKAETLRETAYAFCAGLYPTQTTPPAWQTEAGKENLSFSFGGQFTVSGVQLQKVDTTAKVTEDGTTKEENHTFHRYYKAPDATQGTGDAQ